MIRTKQFIAEVTQLLERNFNDPNFNVTQLCLIVQVSRASIYRKIMSQCNCSPQVFIEEYRLSIAKRKIEENECIIKEVAYGVGFSDPRYFSHRFKQKFCLTPTEYRKGFLKSNFLN